MKPKKYFLSLQQCYLFILLLILLFSKNVFAVSVIERSADEMLQDADEVFYGQVTDIYSQQRFNGQNGQIFTFVQFSKLKQVKAAQASTDSTYVLCMAGGRVANTVQMYPGIPQFVLGERYVIFVRDNKKTAFPLVGIQQGFVHVKKASDGRYMLKFNATNKKLKTHFLDVKKQFSPDVDEKNIDPEDFISTLRGYWLLRKNQLNAIQNN